MKTGPPAVVVGAVGIVGNSEPAESCPQVHSPLSLALRLGLSLEPLSKAVRLAHKLQNVGVVGQPIKQGRRQLFITEDLGPVSEVQIGGHNDRHPFVQGRTATNKMRD